MIETVTREDRYGRRGVQRGASTRRTAGGAEALLIALVFACGQGSETTTRRETVESPVTQDSASPAPASPTLHDAETLDTLTASDGRRWVLVAAVECTECDAPQALWLVPADPAGSPAGPFLHAGEEFEMGEEEAIGRSRVYVGDCVPERGDELVWFSEFRDSAGAWTSDVRVLLVGRRTTASPALSRQTMEAEVNLAVSAGRCRELAP